MYPKFFFLLLLSPSLIFAETGLAGWYGKEFQGRITASGEKFNMYAYTAAHETLPFNTMLTVTNLENGKSVNVKVNDRSPYKKNRLIDLSYQAAKSIGLLNLGTSEVSIKLQESKKVVFPYTLYHTNATQEEIASMKEYALKITSTPNQRKTPQAIAPSVPPKVVKLQVGSFATKKAAKVFIDKENLKGYTMQSISYFSSKFNSFRYKVVILCSSKVMADRIIKSKVYKGAYIVR
jgi:rare lipoprotein A